MTPECLSELRYYVPRGYTGTFEIARVRINRYGYDSGGWYYGTGYPVFTVYWYDQDIGFQSHDVRAYHRAALRATLKSTWPGAKVAR
jgi:hypothetical protein